MAHEALFNLTKIRNVEKFSQADSEDIRISLHPESPVFK